VHTHRAIFGVFATSLVALTSDVGSGASIHDCFASEVAGLHAVARVDTCAAPKLHLGRDHYMQRREWRRYSPGDLARDDLGGNRAINDRRRNPYCSHDFAVAQAVAARSRSGGVE